jgi:peroxiredoxin Q/BCP
MPTKKVKEIPASIVLKTGDKAPEFSVPDQDGNPVSLKDYKGKKVILYFYPKDDTTGCTAEACDLRDHRPLITKKNYEILGVSADSVKSHKKFATKFNLPFKLLADTEKDIITKYGVWGPKIFWGRKYMGILRTTFLIDEKGIIEQVITDVDTKNHTEQILG